MASDGTAGADEAPLAPERTEERAESLRRRLRGPCLVALVRVLGAVLSRLPWLGAQRFGAFVGVLYWTFGRRDRRRALSHLTLAFPELPAARRQELGRGCFRHNAVSLAEMLHLSRAECTAVLARVDFEGWERIEAEQRAGRPILVLTGHCGNWELLAAALNCRGLGLTAVVRQLEEAGLDDLLHRLRLRFGTETIVRGTAGAARRLLGTLRDGRALGMLIDQDTKVDGVWVPFFGRPAYTPRGAAEIALRRGATVLPTFIARRADGSHRARVGAPLALPDDVTAATAVMTRAIEEQIRRAPEQWVWMHRRWRRQPAAEGGSPSGDAGDGTAEGADVVAGAGRDYADQSSGAGRSLRLPPAIQAAPTPSR